MWLGTLTSDSFVLHNLIYFIQLKVKEIINESPIPSQETDQSFSQETDYSQFSEASACVSDKIEKLNDFIGLSGVSPVKKLQGTLQTSSTRTIQRYKLKARQCINTVLETMCPGESSFLLSEIFPEPAKDNTVETLCEIYSKADTWMFKRQVLSILTEQLNYDSLKKVRLINFK